MNKPAPLLLLGTLLLAGLAATAADQPTESERKLVLKLAHDFKKATLANDHKTIVDLLHPEVVKAVGGRKMMLQVLKAEDARNKAAGLTVQSIDLTSTDVAYTGSNARITFVTSTMIVQASGVKMRSRGFFIAFLPTGTSKWYLLDGSNLTDAQFREMFPGLPGDLKLPPVEKTKL